MEIRLRKLFSNLRLASNWQFRLILKTAMPVVIHLNQPVSITVQGIQIRQSCRVTYIELLQAGAACTINIVEIVFIFA